MDKTSEMSPSAPYLNYPAPLAGWVGDEEAFDPLGVSDALPVYYLRESELKHGRVCMLAVIGWIATDSGVRFPGEQFQSVSTIDAHDQMVQLGLMQPMLATVFFMEARPLAGEERRPGHQATGQPGSQVACSFFWLLAWLAGCLAVLSLLGS